MHRPQLCQSAERLVRAMSRLNIARVPNATCSCRRTRFGIEITVFLADLSISCRNSLFRSHALFAKRPGDSSRSCLCRYGEAMSAPAASFRRALGASCKPHDNLIDSFEEVVAKQVEGVNSCRKRGRVGGRRVSVNDVGNRGALQEGTAV